MLGAYECARISGDHVARGPDTGFGDPIIFLDGAARIGGVVVESEGIWQPGTSAQDFERFGTRFIYDDVDSVLRWTAGDMLTRGEGFKASLPLSGLSVQRSLCLLPLTQSVRSTVRNTFFLGCSSTC